MLMCLISSDQAGFSSGLYISILKGLDPVNMILYSLKAVKHAYKFMLVKNLNVSNAKHINKSGPQLTI